MTNAHLKSPSFYCEADPIPTKSFYVQISFYVEILIDIFKSLLLSIPLLIESFMKLIFTHRKSIKGKVVLITGAGNGLGKYIALELGQEKCKIAVADIDYDAAERTAKELRILYGIEAIPYKTDVGDYNSILKLKNDINRDLGIVDILINNAGLLFRLSLREKEWTDLEPCFNVNFKSHFWVCTSIFVFAI